ncbi:Uncharacterised protein [Mycobacteroides abscessus subsp. abscessus]|nr:hypothetical protein [Mycobacteroides abscessus]SHS99937.1 Uncharacterised protein [Mycobacteroides abscessus subsp. abscessus]SLK63961.1 Uncharacterised protein [Mycobacteroides abscessus subsp. abscessus]
MVKRSLVIGAAALSVLLSGCHVSFSSGTDKEAEKPLIPQIAQADLEQGLKDAVKAKQSIVLKESHCNGPLNGKIDATQKCAIVDDEGIHYDVLVTTTSVQGKDIKFKYAVEQTSN